MTTQRQQDFNHKTYQESQELLLFYASLAIGILACGDCRSQRAGEFEVQVEWPNLTV